MEIAVFWFIFALIVGAAAGARGRSSVGWFLLAVVISPLLALILVLVIPSRIKAPPAARPGGTDIPIRSSGYYEPEESAKACPRCAEHVKAAALVCRFCGHEFQPVQALPTVPEARRYGGVPYTLFPDGTVEVILGGERPRMASEAEFIAFIDDGRLQKRS